MEPLTRDLVALVIGLSWPAVVLAAVIVFRRQLPDLARAWSRQGFKVSAGVMSLEVSPATAVPAPEAALAEFGVKPLPSDAPATSAVNELELLLAAEEPLDYAVIDLGVGRSWLTSRVFLFAVLLGRMRSVKVFVFVQTSAGIRRRLIGHVPVESLRWRLAQRQPWLEKAFATAYAAVWTEPVSEYAPQPGVTSDVGRLDYGIALKLIGRYLTPIQQLKVPGEQAPGWVDLPQAPPGQVGDWQERASWIDGPGLQQLTEGIIVFDPVEESGDLSSNERTIKILRRKSAYVALVDKAGQFKSLVDRTELSDQLAAKYTA